MIDVAFDGADEGLGDAVGGGGGVTGLQAVEAVRHGDALLAEGADKRIQERAAGHVHRALHDGDVVLLGVDVHLFEFIRGVTFFGGYEAGGHLHAGEAERKVVFDVFLIKDAAAKDHGNFLFELFFKFFYYGEDFFDFIFITIAFVLLHLLAGVAQVAAGLRAFDDHHVSGAVVVAFPQFQNDASGFRRADDRSDFRIRPFHAGRQVRWEAGAGEDDVRAAFAAQRA